MSDVSKDYRLGSGVYRVTICKECELPIVKEVNHYYFGQSEKGRERMSRFAKQYELLPDYPAHCECAENSDEEEEEEE